VAAVLALAGGAARADGSAPLVVRTTPGTLLLGTDRGAVVEVDGAGDARLVVRASVGGIENVRPLGEGRFAADYVPPPEAFPQIAIVAVLAGERCGWTSIPLVGHGVARARSVPGSPIRVTIGAASFGPVVADARGEAQVPVVVPPGVGFAYHRGKALDLRIPPTPHVELLVARADAPADAAHAVPFFVLAVTPDGGPRAGAPLDVSVTDGRVERLAEIAPGTYAGTWRLEPGRATATITARIADDPAPPRTASLARPAGRAARLALEADRAHLVAGDDERLTLRARVTDAAGNPVADVPQLETTFGTLSPPAAAGAGAWEATLSVPPVLGAARRAEIVARVADLESRMAVQLVPGAPARVALSPSGATLVADGGTEARVGVEVVDRFGNDVAVVAPQVDTSRGGRVRPEQDGSGRWTLRYRPARSREAGAEVLSVRAGELAGSARFELLAAERRWSVSPTLGFAASRAGLRSPYAGAQAAYRTSLLDGRLGFGGDVATFVHDRTDTVQVAGASVSVRGRARYVPMLATLRWRERLGGAQVAWASLGAGISWVSSTVSASGASAREGTGVGAALQASVAWGARLGPGMPFAELRLGWSSDPGIDALRGTLTFAAVSVGYLYDAL
jgi:hypothetical protein